MHRTEDHRGFEISWEDPPLTGAGWTINIASNDPRLMAMIGVSAKVIDAANRDDAIAKAKRFIDYLLGRISVGTTPASADAPLPPDRLRDSIPGLAWEQRSNVPFHPQALQRDPAIYDVTAGNSARTPFPLRGVATPITPPPGTATAISAGGANPEPPTIRVESAVRLGLEVTREDTQSATATATGEGNLTAEGTVQLARATLRVSQEDREIAGRHLDAIRAGLEQIIPLAEALETARRQRGGIGDNQPPEALALAVEDVRLGIDAANVFRTELSVENPRADVVGLCIRALKRVALIVGACAAALGVGFLNTTGGHIADAAWPALEPHVTPLVDLVQKWMM